MPSNPMPGDVLVIAERGSGDLDGVTLQVSTKGRELAGASDRLFIRNSLTGEVQCRTNKKAIALNDQLHAHN